VLCAFFSYEGKRTEPVSDETNALKSRCALLESRCCPALSVESAAGFYPALSTQQTGEVGLIVQLE
jgi:hypothetical protein